MVWLIFFVKVDKIILLLWSKMNCKKKRMELNVEFIQQIHRQQNKKMLSIY